MNPADEQVSGILYALPRVDAPGNFDILLRRRIANHKPANESRTGVLLALKFAMPVIALLGFGAFIIFSDGSKIDQAAVPPVADSSFASTQIDTEFTSPEKPNLLVPDENGIVPVGPHGPNTQALVSPQPSNKLQKDPLIRGGSEDRTVERADDPILPRGFNPGKKVPGPESVSPLTSVLAVQEVLSAVGISCDFGAAGCEVSSVAANSIAARAGLKTGDIVDAIDDKTVNAQTVFRGSFTGKTLHVLRDGKRLSLGLGGKQ